jgi:hypothetical protein
MPARSGNAQIPPSLEPERRAAPPVAGQPGDTDRLLRAMTDVLADRRPSSAAEALRLLRLDYPDIPLAMRIAALCARSK